MSRTAIKKFQFNLMHRIRFLVPRIPYKWNIFYFWGALLYGSTGRHWAWIKYECVRPSYSLFVDETLAAMNGWRDGVYLRLWQSLKIRAHKTVWSIFGGETCARECLWNVVIGMRRICKNVRHLPRSTVSGVAHKNTQRFSGYLLFIHHVDLAMLQ